MKVLRKKLTKKNKIKRGSESRLAESSAGVCLHLILILFFTVKGNNVSLKTLKIK